MTNRFCSPIISEMVKQSLLLGAGVFCALSTSLFAQEIAFENEKDKASYLIGRNIGEQMSADELNLNIELLKTGLEEAVAGKDSQISDEDAQQIMSAFQQEIAEKQNAARAKALEEAKAKSAAFLEENSKKEGVTVTDSGLQYEVMTAAEGDKPTAADEVKVHYHGTLTNGDVFDSSVERGEPITFPLGGVIPGWTEGLQLMSVGAKYRFTIPSDLAYGDRGSPGGIGPGETLIFEVELLEIVKAEAPATEAAAE